MRERFERAVDGHMPISGNDFKFSAYVLHFLSKISKANYLFQESSENFFNTVFSIFSAFSSEMSAFKASFAIS